VAKKVPHIVYFGKNPLKPDEYRGEDVMDPPIQLVDDYYWLRDDSRTDPEVLSHIKAENEYTEDSMKSLAPLRESLYSKMLSRLKETDEDVPYPDGKYLYYSRTVAGLSYKIHCRKLKLGGGEEVLLDENEVAKGNEYSVVGSHEVSPSTSLLVWSWDTTGDEHYDIRFKDLSSNQPLDDIVEDCSSDVEWSADSKAIFYTKQDAESRPYQAWMHVLGTPVEQDVMLLEENDGLFWMGLGKTSDERFLVVSLGSKETSECHVLNLQELAAAAAPAKDLLKCVQSRDFGVRYDVEAQGDKFLIVTNADGAKQNKLVEVDIATPGRPNWKDVKPYDSLVQVDAVQSFKTHLAIVGREGGLERVWIAPAARPSQWRALEFKENCHSVSVAENAEYDTDRVRLVYSSLVTPRKVLDVSFGDEKQHLLKQVDVPNYDSSSYRTCRISLPAQDGLSVPVSLVFKASLLADPQQSLEAGQMPVFSKPNACLLYGYGSYGACIDPTFDFKRTVLLDYDVVYVIAHIRGGGELGQWWYEDEGKYLKKPNTFADFADVAKGLIKLGVTVTPKLAMVGRSAGGLLMGAVLNRDGNLFKCAVADVAFLDVTTTMSDPTIPLTVGEWEEWGNPNTSKFFESMKSYSPVDNVAAKDYPALLVTAGLNDPRVTYWECAKFVAKMRALKTNDTPLYLKTDMSSGHFSASDRYKFLREMAFEYAFILDQIVGK